MLKNLKNLKKRLFFACKLMTKKKVELKLNRDLETSDLLGTPRIINNTSKNN